MWQDFLYDHLKFTAKEQSCPATSACNDKIGSSLVKTTFFKLDLLF